MNATPPDSSRSEPAIPLAHDAPPPAWRRRLAVLGLASVMVGCGPIVRYDAEGRAMSSSWRGGPTNGERGPVDVRATAVDRRVARGTGSADRVVTRASSPRRVVVDATRPTVAAPPARTSATAPASARVAPGDAAPAMTATTAAPPRVSPHPARVSEPHRTPAPAPDTTREPGLIGAAGSVRLVRSAPAHLPLGLGVLEQRANIDELLGADTAPSEVLGLDVPPDALVNAWAADPVELMVARGGGIIVRFGDPMPHEVDGGIVGRLRERGWLAIDVHSVAEDPSRLADAVTSACDALDELVVVDPDGTAVLDAAERPLVLLGFGTGIAETLTVLEHARRAPVAVVIVSRPDADPISVRQIDGALGAAPVPVLHLRSVDAVGGSASIRDLVTRGGLEDATAPAAGLTGWTYARRPGPGIAWLPMLVDPVVDWVVRAAEPSSGHVSGPRTASARP